MQIDNFALIIFLGCVALGSTQNANNNSLFCYECNPTSAYGCVNPTNNNQINCSTYAFGNISNWRFSCHSSYLNYNNVTGNSAWNNRTGIHRGCILYPATSQDNFCWLNPGVNVTRVSCATCATSYCNNHVFNAAGGISGGGSGGSGSGGWRPGRNGANEIVPPIIILIIALIYLKNIN